MVIKRILPTISIVIPTLNAESVLNNCLKSIREQNYPQDHLEIVIADGGSTDKTLQIAKQYFCHVVKNPLITGEAGKAIGIKYATGKYIALIDSDNILPTIDWFSKMLDPLEKDNDLIGSEPWEYTYRKNGGFIERYSSLTGVNDPYALITGMYDRKNFLRPGWTNLKLHIINHPKYQTVTLNSSDRLPSIGANGTILRRSQIIKYIRDYFVDIDILSEILHQQDKSLRFAKVKIGIIHTFCESSVSKFYRKQLRRVKDLYFFQRPYRSSDQYESKFWPQIMFSIYVVLILPMFYDTFLGFFRKPDIAWFFHPLACLITLFTYAYVTIQKLIGLKPIQNRQTWGQ